MEDKVYCMKLTCFTTKDKTTFFKALCYSTYGFLFDLFIDDDHYDIYDDIISEKGFADITRDVRLRYDNKLDKLVYTLNK